MHEKDDNIDLSQSEELLLREAATRAFADHHPDVEKELAGFLMSKGIEKDGHGIPSRKRGTLPSRRWTMMAAGVAVLVVVVGIGAFLAGRLTAGSSLLAASGYAGSVSITAPEGQRCEVVLADGTKVWLNGGSTLSYTERFDAAHRAVKLTGEAFFDVAKDAARPFVVNTPYLVTKVFGTQFNIRCYTADDCHVTLVSGSIEVTPLANKQNAVRMKPGNDVRITKKGETEMTEMAVKAAEHLSWQKGSFEFDNVALETVLEELSQWYAVPVIVKGEKTNSQKIHFSLDRNASLQQAAELLNSLCVAEISTDGNSIIVNE